MKPYKPEIEKQMIIFYNSLNEKDKRMYAASEAMKLGYGGKTYIHKLLGCDHKTITRGEKDLRNEELLKLDRIRIEGGGRKSKLTSIPNIDEVFISVIKNNTAGNPMDAEIKWTNLILEDISKLMKEKGVNVSVHVVKQLLKKHSFKKRKAQKMISTGECAERDKQFINISRLKKEYIDSNNPIISIDTKKKNS
jgi:hypothetical protein